MSIGEDFKEREISDIQDYKKPYFALFYLIFKHQLTTMLYDLKQILLPFENSYQNVIAETSEGSKGLSTLANTLVISPVHRNIAQNLCDVLNDNIEVESDLVISHLIQIAQLFNPQNNVNADFLRSTLNKFVTEKTDLDPAFDGTFKSQHNSSSDNFSFIELSIFELYQVTVLHMWVTQDPFIATKSLKATQPIIMEGYSLNKSAKADPSILDIGDNKNTIQEYNTIKSFLASSATQFTEFGLQLAQSKLNCQDVVIFYKNEQFQTLLKADDGILYILTPILDSDLNWRSLQSVNGTSDDYLNTLQGAKSTPFNNPSSTQGVSDEELARQLQIKEDAKYAEMINNEPRNKKNSSNTEKYIAKKQKQIKKNERKMKKKAKKCIIM